MQSSAEAAAPADWRDLSRTCIVTTGVPILGFPRRRPQLRPHLHRYSGRVFRVSTVAERAIDLRYIFDFPPIKSCLSLVVAKVTRTRKLQKSYDLRA